MTTFPAAAYLSNAGRTEGEMKTALEDFLAATKQLPGGSPESALTIASGVITPTGALHSVDTEAAAATDDLTNATVTNLPDGSMLLLRAANAGRVVTVKYAAGGTGQFDLKGQQDVVLGSIYAWLLLKQTGGSVWTEIARILPEALEVAEYARLDFTNANTVTLRAGVIPVWIAAQSVWQLRLVPDTGIALGNGGLSANTKYFIYAFASGAGTFLEASTTGRAVNGGVQCKQADRSRTLVGMLYTNGAAQFEDSGAGRTVVSWYSRRARAAIRSTAGPLTSNLTTPSVLSSGIGFLQWGDGTDALLGVTATAANNTATQSIASFLFLDGSAYASSIAQSSFANGLNAMALTKPVSVAVDALRIVQFGGQVGGGSGSWSGIEEWAQFSG